MKGVVRSGFCIAENIMDTVPVDVCINLMIAVAWYTATVKWVTWHSLRVLQFFLCVCLAVILIIVSKFLNSSSYKH